MISSAIFPGVQFAIRKPDASVSALRTDIAGFIGGTARGPVDTPSRVEGWRDYQEVYGGVTSGQFTPNSVEGYFENGGQLAFIHRINKGPATSASKMWQLNPLDPNAPVLLIQAKTPGIWGNTLKINLTVRRVAGSSDAALDMRVSSNGDAEEINDGIPLTSQGLEALSEQSALVTISLKKAEPICPDVLDQLFQSQGRIIRQDLTMDPVPDATMGLDNLKAAYQEALARILQQREVSIVILPDLIHDIQAPSDRATVLDQAIRDIDDLHDRLLIVDLPTNGELLELAAYRQGQQSRNVAAYYPWLSIPDPFDPAGEALLDIPPSGHVAGVISRLDRSRGPFFTPANAPLLEVVDLAEAKPDTVANLFESGINVLRSFPGKGLYVWGGRTLQQDENFMYISHRRIVHRLVRAIRNVAEALVFETNGPELWLALTRGITSVLLQAYRAGALQGKDPKEAFEVRCDASTTSEDDRQNGVVHCEIAFAPAVPMEFIYLRIGISREGQLDILET